MAQYLMLCILSTHSTHVQGYSQYKHNTGTTLAIYTLHTYQCTHTWSQRNTHTTINTIQRSYVREKQGLCCYYMVVAQRASGLDKVSGCLRQAALAASHTSPHLRCVLCQDGFTQFVASIMRL